MPGTVLGAVWGEDGYIIFGSLSNTGLLRVPATGGTPSPLTALDASRNETAHGWPQALPGGHFLYQIVSGKAEASGTARDALLNAIHEVPPNSLILVLGPTGVGKTTLRAKIEQRLAAEMVSTLEVDPERLAIVSVECIAPESGSFGWRDHFRRLLLQMEEPLVDYKINPAARIRTGEKVVRFMPSAKAVGAEYHHAVERALAFRRPVAVLIDEAQHLARRVPGAGYQTSWMSSNPWPIAPRPSTS